MLTLRSVRQALGHMDPLLIDGITAFIGMRERVAVFGGEFAAGPGPEGGFRVRACFPIAEVRS